MNLRNYQTDASDAAFREWNNGAKSTLIVCPTGTGKTVIFADIISRFQPRRAMVIAHRKELIYQAKDKIQALTGLQCGIEMADNYVNNSLFGKLPVVISTIQTQSKRMSRFKPEEFGVLIIDEAHHMVARTYQNLINYYREHNPDIKVLAVTATPDRGDEEALGQIVDTVAFDYEILNAINDGWLVPVEQQMVTLGSLDLSQVRTTAGDLNGADLAAIMESEKNLQGVVQPTLEALWGLDQHSLDHIHPTMWASFESIQPSKRAIVFTVSVAQAEMLSNIFNRVQPDLSGWVCGRTKDEIRDETLKKFMQGQTRIMVNVGVLTEGFDDPGVDMIVMARPTKSRALYAQMCGRAMRPLPGLVDGLATAEERRQAIATSPKKTMLVMDFVGNSGKHKLVTSADILGGKVSAAAVANVLAKARTTGAPINMTEELEDAEQELQKLAAQARQQEEARKARLLLKTGYTTRTVSAFDAFDITPTQQRGWDKGKVLTEKQRRLLLRQGINPDEMSYAEGRQMVTELFRRWDKNLCTIRQARLLKKYGYETKELTIPEATKLIDQLAANGWHRPDRTNHVPLLTTTTP